jgi:hypothetical protein
LLQSIPPPHSDLICRRAAVCGFAALIANAGAIS